MLRNGFLRFCDDPEITCCRAEAELGQLRTENARLTKERDEAQRRERALLNFAISADRDYMECDKMFIHAGRLRQDTGYNAYLIDARQSGAKPLTFEQYLRGLQEAAR